MSHHFGEANHALHTKIAPKILRRTRIVDRSYLSPGCNIWIKQIHLLNLIGIKRIFRHFILRIFFANNLEYRRSPILYLTRISVFNHTRIVVNTGYLRIWFVNRIIAWKPWLRMSELFKESANGEISENGYATLYTAAYAKTYHKKMKRTIINSKNLGFYASPQEAIRNLKLNQSGNCINVIVGDIVTISAVLIGPMSTSDANATLSVY